jgi:putative membrane protein insertion efficiency factor
VVLPSDSLVEAQWARSMDLNSPPLSPHPVKGLLESCLRGYRLIFSRLDGPTCGFHPSCSRYAALAVKSRGPSLGILLTGDRLLRCHPDPNDPSPRLPDGRRVDFPPGKRP